MDIGKVGAVFKDWVRGGYWFGKSFSSRLSDRLEVSPQAARFGGGLFDLAAGGGITYMAAMSALGTLASTATAVGAIASAPVGAAVAVATGTVWMALSCMTGGIGLGLLSAAHDKSGLPALGGGGLGRLKQNVADVAVSAKGSFKAGVRPTSFFNGRAQRPERPLPPSKPVVTPKAGPDGPH